MKTIVDAAIPKLQIRLKGDWHKATEFPKMVALIVKRASNKSSKDFATNLYKIIRTAISTGTPPIGGGVYWQELSQASIQRWGANTLYNLTGEMLHALTIKGEGARRVVGLRNTRHSYGSNLSMARVSKILEYGTHYGIPARPLWAPSLKASGGSVGLAKLTVSNIQKGLRAKYGRGAKVGV